MSNRKVKDPLDKRTLQAFTLRERMRDIIEESFEKHGYSSKSKFVESAILEKIKRWENQR